MMLGSLCRGSFDCHHACEVYSIWEVSPWKLYQSMMDFLFPADIALCRPEWFPFVYWLTLGISLMGCFYSCYELLCIYCGWGMLSTFREQKYRILPPVFRRNVRLVGAVFMLRLWMSLAIGIAMVQPWVISMWLKIYLGFFYLELVLWLGEMLFGTTKLNAKSIWSHFSCFGTLFLVRCVRDVFLLVMERHGNTDLLQLLS